MSHMRSKFRKLFNLDKPPEQSRVTVSRSSDGPGEYDFWGRMEGRTDNYLQLSAKKSATKKKKKMIISDDSLSLILNVQPEEKRTKHIDFFISFFSEVFKEFEVVYWPGAAHKLSSQRPLTTTKELLDNLHLAKLASATSIYQSLAEAGLPVDDYVVLDKLTNQNIMEYFQNVYRQADEENLPVLPIRKLILSSDNEDLSIYNLYQHQIHTVVLNDYSDQAFFTKLVQFFPEIKKIHYAYAPVQVIFSDAGILSALRNRSIEVDENVFRKNVIAHGGLDNQIISIPDGAILNQVILNHVGEQKIIAGNCAVQELILKKEYISLIDKSLKVTLTSINLKNIKNLRKLVLENIAISDLILPDEKTALRTLEITSEHLPPKIDLSYFNNLTDVKLVNRPGSDTQVVWPKNKAIQCLTISSNLLQKNPYDLQHIQELKLEVNTEQKKFDFSTCRALTKLTITGIKSFVTAQIAWPKINTIKSLALNARESDEVIDLTQFEGLEEIKLSGFKNLKTIIWPSNKNNIRKIILVGCGELSTLDLRGFSSLSEVTLSSCNCKIVCDKITSINKITLVKHGTKVDLTSAKHIHELEINSDLESNHVMLHPDLQTLSMNSCTAEVDTSVCRSLADIKIDIKHPHTLKNKVILSGSVFSEKTESIVLNRCPVACALSAKPISTNILSLTKCELQDGILDLRGFSYIGNLKLVGNNIRKIIFPENIVIEHLHIENEKQLKDLDLSRVKNLHAISVYSPSDSTKCSLHLPDQTDALRILQIKNIAIAERINKFNNLEKMYLHDVDFPQVHNQIDLSAMRKLKELFIQSSNDCQINIAGDVNLQKVNIYASERNVIIDGLSSCQKIGKYEFNLTCANQKIAQHTFMQDLPPACRPEITDDNVSNEQKRTLALVELSYANKKHPVSRFNLIGERGISYDTSMPPPDVYQGDIQVTLFSQERAKKQEYCIERFDRCKYNPVTKEITFYSDARRETVPFIQSASNTMAAFMQAVYANPQNEAGVLEGKFEQGKYYSIINSAPIMRCDDNIGRHLYTEPADAIDELCWETENQRYGFKLKKGVTKVKIFYQFERDPSYRQPIPSKTSYCPSGDAVDKTLRDELTQRLIQHEALKFLFDAQLTKEQKLELLIQYCTFPPTRPGLLPAKNDLDELISQIIDRRGYCEHRSEIFMLLASLIDVKASYYINADHAVPEIWTMQGGHIHLHAYDSVGGTPYLNITPVSERPVDPFEALKLKENKDEKKLETQAASASPVASQKKEQAPIDEKFIAKKQFYTEELKKASETCYLHSIDNMLFTAANTPVLIEYEEKQKLSTVNYMLSQLTKNRNVVYIDRPEDFSVYFSPLKLTAGEYKEMPNGLLRQLISGIEPTVLVVNWANFSAEQLATFQSLLEKRPVLFEKKVTNPNLRIVGLATKKLTQAPQKYGAFLSRCQKAVLTKEFFSQPMPTVEVDETAHEITIDLNYRQNWKSALWGACNPYEIIESDFIKALRAGKPIHLTIKNKPDHCPDLDVFLSRVLYERKILFNGDLIPVVGNIKVDYQQEKPVIAAENITLHLLEEKTEKRPKVYLNLNNLYECLKKQVYVDGKLKSPDGHFALYQHGEVIFYLTESIPLTEWQVLVKEIATHYQGQGRNFHFMLAPGVSIENVAENLAEPTVTKITPDEFKLPPVGGQIFVSNDTAEVVRQLKQQHPDAEIFEVSLLTRTSEIIARASYKDGKHSYEEQTVLNELLKGHTVILHGPISEGLYQSLLPLLSSPPRFLSNGVWLPDGSKPFGRLIVVTPPGADYTYLNATSCEYQLKDYRKLFVAENKADEQRINQLFAYCQAATSLPLAKGSSLFSYTLLHKMHKKLKNGNYKAHLHNPIKHLINARYPAGSEERAFLNVMGKYYFAEADESAFRKYKIQRLIKQYNIQSLDTLKLHAWEIINCFNGKELHALLGESLKDPEKLFLSLDDTILQKLFYGYVQDIAAIKDTLPKVSKQPEKNIAEALEFFANDDENLAILEGPPGTGKTHLVRNELKKLNKFIVCEGDHKGILKWLKANPADGIPLLFLDEANMQLPGEWNFLEGCLLNREVWYRDDNGGCDLQLMSSNPIDNRIVNNDLYLHQQNDSIWYATKTSQGIIRAEITKEEYQEYFDYLIALLKKPATEKEKINDKAKAALLDITSKRGHTHNGKLTKFPLSPQHKIIAAMNPNEDKDTTRYIHTLFQRAPQTITFKKPTSEMLQKHILNVILSSHPDLNKPEYKKYLLEAYKKISDYNPMLVTSVRDMQDLASRFVMLCEMEGHEPKEAAYRACLVGFAGSIPDIAKRKEYIEYLENTILEEHRPVSPPTLQALNDQYFIPSEKSYLLDAIKQFINLYQYSGIATDLICKTGLVIEGDPGLGKSLVIRALLNEYNIEYIDINAGSAEARKQIREAFFNGKFIVLDEMDVDPEIEKLLGHYLTGERVPGPDPVADDPDRPIVPGFRCIASKNSTMLAGREPLSDAMQNRVKLEYFDDYIEEELQRFIMDKKIDAQAFVEAFIEMRRLDPGINVRVFHRVLNKLSAGVDEFIPATALPPSLQLRLSEAYQKAVEEKNENNVTLLGYLNTRLSHAQAQDYAAVVDEVIKLISLEPSEKLLKNILDDICQVKEPYQIAPLLNDLDKTYAELRETTQVTVLLAITAFRESLEKSSGSASCALARVKKDFPAEANIIEAMVQNSEQPSSSGYGMSVQGSGYISGPKVS